MAVRSKYRNKKTIVDGIKFDSRKESRYYEYLKLLQSQGKIHGLEMQVRFKFPINGVNLRYVDSNREITYVADFVCFTSEGERKVIDVKGQVFANGASLTEAQRARKNVLFTRDYLIKKALMYAVHGVVIEEV